MENKEIVWNYFKEKIGNEYGVGGLLGNLQSESGFYPDRKQGDIPYSSVSKNYADSVDNGTYSESKFVNDGIGFGLAQWTWHTRKQNLYNYKVSTGCGIANLQMQLDFLYQELQTDYASVLSVLLSCTTLREASDKVLHDFENPKVQTVEVEEERCALGQALYDEFHGSGGGEVVPPVEKHEVYDKLLTTCYKMNQLSENQLAFIKTLNFGDTVKFNHSFDKNKSSYGKNCFGNHLTNFNKSYIINSVKGNGFVVLGNGTSLNVITVNPKFLKEV